MDCNKLFEKIDELYPFYLKVWEDVCNIESPTAYKKGVDAVCDYFLKLAEERGWDIEVEDYEVAGKVACITLNPDAPGAPVCLSGHIDTVHPVGLFPTPAVSMDEEKIYGPGVEDCKGGCVACFYAMDALSQIGFKDRPVKFIIQSDEETSSKTSGKKTIEFMCKKSEGAVAFLNTEGRVGSNGENIVLERKGIWRARFNFVGKAAHSSKCYTGVNAILEAAHKIIELEKFKDPSGITCNCAVIEGGTVANTVPEKCSFLADFRYSTIAERDFIKAKVEELCKTSSVEGCVCSFEEISSRPPMEFVDRNLELFNKMNEIFVKCGLSELGYEKSNGGSDAAYITIAGIPCIDDIGIFGGRIHSVEEYAYQESLKDSALRMAVVAKYIK